MFCVFFTSDVPYVSKKIRKKPVKTLILFFKIFDQSLFKICLNTICSLFIGPNFIKPYCVKLRAAQIQYYLIDPDYYLCCIIIKAWQLQHPMPMPVLFSFGTTFYQSAHAMRLIFRLASSIYYIPTKYLRKRHIKAQSEENKIIPNLSKQHTYGNK